VGVPAERRAVALAVGDPQELPVGVVDLGDRVARGGRDHDLQTIPGERGGHEGSELAGGVGLGCDAAVTAVGVGQHHDAAAVCLGAQAVLGVVGERPGVAAGIGEIGEITVAVVCELRGRPARGRRRDGGDAPAGPGEIDLPAHRVGDAVKLRGVGEGDRVVARVGDLRQPAGRVEQPRQAVGEGEAPAVRRAVRERRGRGAVERGIGGTALLEEPAAAVGHDHGVILAVFLDAHGQAVRPPETEGAVLAGEMRVVAHGERQIQAHPAREAEQRAVEEEVAG